MELPVKDPTNAPRAAFAPLRSTEVWPSGDHDARSLVAKQYGRAPETEASPRLSTAGMMHDLGNLLQVIASANRMIERSVVGQRYEDLEELARSSLSAIARAIDLRARMLSSFPPGSGREVTSLETSISAISDLIVLSAGAHVEVDFVTSGEVPTVLCDRRELENAVLNLVANAKDAMPLGGVLTVSLAARPVGRRNGAAGNCDRVDALLSIGDTGEGMSPEIQKSVFDAFFTTKSDGHGLGLAMVDAFARNSGGSVGVESGVGLGTTITLRLPGLQPASGITLSPAQREVIRG